MYGMSMDRFLSLDPRTPLSPHQEHLRSGMLTPYPIIEDMEMLFVLHEWLSYKHIDPKE